MQDDKQLDHLIAVLYETVLDPSRWREAIGLCGHYAGAVDAQLLTLEKHQKTLGRVDIYYLSQMRAETKCKKPMKFLAFLSKREKTLR